MNRTIRYRLFSALAVIALLAIIFGVLYVANGNLWVILAIIITMLLPGRIQSRYWRDYFQGQRSYGKGKYLEALVSFEKFLKNIRTHPQLKRLIWFSTGAYTRDIEVMALNNMGVCYLCLENVGQAEGLFQSARTLDPESPLPFYHLALLYQVRGDDTLAEENLNKAEALGYRRSSIKSVRKDLADTTQAPRVEQEDDRRGT
jgi:tetratricopeptide (TPR) repeat protein